MKFHPPIVVHVDLTRKFGELETFSELILSFSGHISTLLTSARMPKFDAAWTKKWKLFTFPRWFLVHFFTICQEMVEKAVYRKKLGVTDHLRESEKLQAKLTQRLPSIYVLRNFAKRARSMHDVAWHCAMNYVRSKDAQKQLAWTSLSFKMIKRTLTFLVHRVCNRIHVIVFINSYTGPAERIFEWGG